MKTIYSRVLCCLLLYLFIFLAPQTGMAQSKTGDCKPVKRANRNKSWQFQSYSVLESEYEADNYIIRRIHNGKTDSIYVYGTNGKLVNSLLCDQGGGILSSLHLDYVADGSLRTDSIVLGNGGHTNWYFNGLLYSDAVRLTEGRMDGTKRYYDSRGKDSLWIVHTAGKLRLMTWYRNGYDSLQRRWNEQGQLEYEKTRYTEMIWDTHQKLVQRSFDTLIRDKIVRCEKIWHPTGALASVTYHYFDQPCFTWKYYNEKGKLIKQIRQEDLDQLCPVAAIEGPEQVYRVVDQKEDAAPQFNRQLNQELAELLCRTRVQPEGTYRLQVWLDASGKLTLKEIEGAYADEIRPEMQTIFSELSRAQPAKRNGRPYARLLQVNLVVNKAK